MGPHHGLEEGNQHPLICLQWRSTSSFYFSSWLQCAHVTVGLGEQEGAAPRGGPAGVAQRGVPPPPDRSQWLHASHLSCWSASVGAEGWPEVEFLKTMYLLKSEQILPLETPHLPGAGPAAADRNPRTAGAGLFQDREVGPSCAGCPGGGEPRGHGSQAPASLRPRPGPGHPQPQPDTGGLSSSVGERGARGQPCGRQLWE